MTVVVGVDDLKFCPVKTDPWMKWSIELLPCGAWWLSWVANLRVTTGGWRTKLVVVLGGGGGLNR